MKAVQYRTIGAQPEVVEIETPAPGPGEVLLKVTAAGLCHSDSFIMSLPEEAYIYGLPLTLGHEGAGTVAAVGEGVTQIAVGENVLVYGPWGCGACHTCSRGFENYCTRAADLGITPPGLGSPGALAEYMIVGSPRHLVPIGDLDPVAAVPLTDAGLTPYHAIKRSLSALVPGSVTVVIGTGGLGHVAIQLLRALSPTTVIALDVTEEKLALAREVGAHHALLSDASAEAAIQDLTGGRGTTLVLDFVAAQATVDLALKVAAIDSDVTIVGVGPGEARFSILSVPFGIRVGTTYWGSRTELAELVALARTGVLNVATERYSLEDAPAAYAKLHEGTIRGRAVVVP